MQTCYLRALSIVLLLCAWAGSTPNAAPFAPTGPDLDVAYTEMVWLDGSRWSIGSPAVGGCSRGKGWCLD